MTTSDSSLEGDLASWGKVILLRTRGRTTGRTRSASVGFIAESGLGGPLLIAASGHETQWARNLLVDGDCTVVQEGHGRPYRAQPLHGEERQSTVAGLILKYGTPAEQLGAGPAFRLLPRVAGERTQVLS